MASIMVYGQTHGMDKKVHPNDELLDTSRPDYVFVAKEAHANARQNKLIRWNPDDIWYAQEVGPVPVEVTMHAADDKTARRLIYGGIHVTDVFVYQGMPSEELCNGAVNALYKKNISFPVVVTRGKQAASYRFLSSQGTYLITLPRHGKFPTLQKFPALQLEDLGHEIGHLHLDYMRNDEEKKALKIRQKRHRILRANYKYNVIQQNEIKELEEIARELQEEEFYCDAFATELGTSINEKITIIDAIIEDFKNDQNFACYRDVAWEIETHPSYETRIHALEKYRSELLQKNGE